jgi:hypothetical protein
MIALLGTGLAFSFAIAVLVGKSFALGRDAADEGPPSPPQESGPPRSLFDNLDNI